METAEIADIVADTLSGYILFGKRRLVCQVVPQDKVHDKLFFKFVYKPPEPPKQKKSLTKIKQVTERLVERERRKRKVMEEMGIEYDFPGFEAAVPPEELQEYKKARKVSDVDVEHAEKQNDEADSGKKELKSKPKTIDKDNKPAEEEKVKTPVVSTPKGKKSQKKHSSKEKKTIDTNNKTAAEKEVKTPDVSTPKERKSPSSKEKKTIDKNNKPAEEEEVKTPDVSTPKGKKSKKKHSSKEKAKSSTKKTQKH